MLRHLVNCTSVLALSLTFGCSTITGNHQEAIRIQDVDKPISDIRVAISEVLPAGQRTMSPNGREIQSRHFLPDGKGGFKPADDALERYFAHLAILGDRRPYQIEILVTHEKRVTRGSQYTFIVDRYDKRLAKDLAKRLRLELTKRREDRNIIDDFRVY